MSDDKLDSAVERNGKYQHFVDHCLDYKDKCEKSDYRQNKIDAITEAYRVYSHKPEKKTKYWDKESNVVLPLTSITVDNLEPRLVAGLVGKHPIVKFEMDGMTEQDDMLRVLEDWYNDELKHTVGIDRVAGTVVHKALLEGTVYPIADYEEDTVLRRDYRFDQMGNVIVNPEDGTPITQEIEDNIFAGGRVKYAEFNDVYVSDDIDDWKNADIIRIVRPTYGDLMTAKDKPGYQNIGPWLIHEEQENSERQDESKPISGSAEDVGVGAEETIECLECSMNYVFQGEGEDKADIKNWVSQRYYALITKDTKVLIRFMPLIDINWKNEPLVKRVRLFGEQGKSYGTSIYEKLKSIQTGSDDLYNLTINIATICMIPWFLYSDAAGWDGEQEIKPGKGIKVDDPSQVMFPKFNQNPRNNIVFIEMFQTFWEKVGSISDIQVGKINEGSKDVTATETMAAIQEGNIKHNYQGVTLKEDFVALIRSIYDLYYQKMPYDKKYVFHGREVMIPRFLMRRRFKFKLIGSSDLSNKILEMQKADSNYQMMRQDPMINGMKLIEDKIKATNDDADPKSYFDPGLNQMLATLQQFPQMAQILQNPQAVEQILQMMQQQQDPQAQADLALKQQELQLKSAAGQQDMQIKDAKAKQEAILKEQKAQQDARIKEKQAEDDRRLKHLAAVADAARKREQQANQNRQKADK